MININRKFAVELKSSTQTDNSSSRERNFQKLLEFKEKCPEYELFYLCINHTTKECQNKLLDNGITFLTGKHALEFLYGENYNEVILTIQKCVKDFASSDIFKLRETSKASTTTSVVGKWGFQDKLHSMTPPKTLIWEMHSMTPLQGNECIH